MIRIPSDPLSVISGKTPRKQREIVERVRNRIISGELEPGDRIPTQAELLEIFPVSSVTVQRATDRLTADGFIESQGHRGTFVSENPPHLCRFPIVMRGARFLGGSLSLFDQTLLRVVQAAERSGRRQFPIFHIFSCVSACDSYRSLADDIVNHRLAGLIIEDSYMFRKTPLLDEPGIARVGIGGLASDPPAGVPHIRIDHVALLDRALTALLDAGCRKIALIVSTAVYGAIADELEPVLVRRGVSIPDHWVQIVPASLPAAVTNSIRLLMHSGSSERPDGLLVLDDNLVEAVCEGLAASDVRVPEDLAVVAHANFPLDHPAPLPFRRIGFDLRELLDACVASIEAQRAGEKTPAAIDLNVVVMDRDGISEDLSRR